MPELGRVKEEFRCFCKFRPLLAVIRVKPNGRPYVHIRIYKGTRLYGEFFVRSGMIEVRCRDCLRLHTIRLTKQNAEFIRARDVLPSEPARLVPGR